MLTFLKRNKPLVLSGLFMILSLHIVSQSIRGLSQEEALRALLQDMVYPVQEALHTVVSRTQSLFHQYVMLQGAQRDLDAARVQLERLSQENARLREAAISNDRLRKLLELQESLGTPGVAAEVVGRDGGSLFRSLILNKGSVQGIKKGMIVVSTGGAVGQIFSVSRVSSRVLLIVDPHSGVDAIAQRSRARGVIQGNLAGCIMKYVQREDDIQPGDQILSSGADGLFPKGLLIGTVSRVSRKNHGLFQEIEVRPKTNFSALEEVLILPTPLTG